MKHYNTNMKITAKQMKETVMHGLNTAGNKMTDLGDWALDNIGKVIMVPSIVGMMAGGGYGFTKTEAGIALENQGAKARYEQEADVILEKRSQFIAAGANRQILKVFDEQNPQPEQPKMKKADTAERVAYTLFGAAAGGVGGLALGITGVVGAAVAEEKQKQRKKAIKKAKKKAKANEIEIEI
jgi:hypothetical protein